MTPEMLRERPIRRLISETAGVYLQALDDSSIQYEIPAEMRQSLEQDIFVFSGFKTYHQLKEASELLRDSQGRVKSFNQFYQDVSAIRKKYNRNWLHAEYNFAVSSAQMASHWAEYQQDEEMTNLQYRTALDDKVRPEHAALEGVTLPMSDPFWDTAFPPNGWNCRCHVIPVLKEDFPLSNSQRAQDAFDDMTQGKASIFRYNPGKEGVIFPPHHPYYGKRGYKHCLNPHLATSLGDNLECDIHYNLKKGEDLEDRDAVREQLRAVLPKGGVEVKLCSEGPRRARLSYQNVKTITGKPHLYPAERNEALVLIATKSPNVELQYLGMSYDIKETKKRGHQQNDRWHYYRVKGLKHDSYLSVKERNGVCNLHAIQDSAHFDESKIMFPYKEEKAKN